jgi:hypothetical protein
MEIRQVRGSSTSIDQCKMLGGYTERAAYQERMCMRSTLARTTENLSNPAGLRPVGEDTLRC